MGHEASVQINANMSLNGNKSSGFTSKIQRMLNEGYMVVEFQRLKVSDQEENGVEIVSLSSVSPKHTGIYGLCGGEVKRKTS